jgi:hypothetical protein
MVEKTAGALCSLAVALAILAACGGTPPPRPPEEGVDLTLPAGRGDTVSMTLPPSDATAVDSITGPHDNPTAVVSLTPNESARIRAVAIPEAGTDAETRMEYLREAGLDSVAVIGGPEDGDGVPLVSYYTGDSASLERVWACGSNQLLALRATMAGDSRGILLRYLGDALRSAERRPWSGLRSVYLADRTREEIFREAGEGDVTPPPRVSHSLHLGIFPTVHRLDLLDTLTIDFSRTPADSQLALNPPERAGGSVGALTPIRGRVSQSGGMMVCSADSERVFRGVYSTSLEGFFLRADGHEYTLMGQVKLNLSFCCGAWLHPWSEGPADYDLTIEAPAGYSVYAPLEEVSGSSTDTLETRRFTSPEGGIRGPVAWAVGYFDREELRSGSVAILPESDTLAASGEEEDARAGLQTRTAVDWAENLNRFLWKYMGFEGARLDYILIRGLDGEVLRAGPGCLFLSPELLVSLGDYPSWPDSLRSGSRPPGADVVGAATAAMLSRSTYLDPALERALCGWSVLRYYEDNFPDNAPGSSMMRQAFLRYYLYRTEVEGGTEYSIADPRVTDGPLADPVLLGKAPLVLDMFADRLQRFELGLQRSLGSLRHSGNSFLRLHSALRITDDPGREALFWRWLTYPGIPQLMVTWSDSAGVLYLQVSQWQAGLDFPVMLDSVRVGFTDGSSAGLVLSRRQGGHMYVAVLPDTTREVLSLEVNPDRRVPADAFYRRGSSE